MGNKGSTSYKKTVKRLSAVDPDTVPKIPYKDERIPCRVIDVYDGDTCTILLMLGKKVPFRIQLRSLGIDTPEKARASDHEKEAGKAVADYVRGLILDKILDVQLTKWDKYGGRLDGVLWIDDTETLTEHLLSHGMGKSYYGDKKGDWTSKELDNVIAACKDLQMNYEFTSLHDYTMGKTKVTSSSSAEDDTLRA